MNFLYRTEGPLWDIPTHSLIQFFKTQVLRRGEHELYISHRWAITEQLNLTLIPLVRPNSSNSLKLRY